MALRPHKVLKTIIVLELNAQNRLMLKNLLTLRNVQKKPLESLPSEESSFIICLNELLQPNYCLDL